MTKARKTDPKSSHVAAIKASDKAASDRAVIRKALLKKPLMTARELEKYLKYKLSYHAIMRRLNEVAVKGDIRKCKTGLPSCNVCEWYVA